MKTIRISLFVLLLLLSVQVHAQKIFLVSVGVADYPGASIDLTLPAQDARAMHRLYKTNSNATSVVLTNSKARRMRILQKNF